MLNVIQVFTQLSKVACVFCCVLTHERRSTCLQDGWLALSGRRLSIALRYGMVQILIMVSCFLALVVIDMLEMDATLVGFKDV